MSYIGDFPEDHTTVSILFTTHAASGAAVAPSTGFEAADVILYKNGSATQKTTTNGITMTSPFDSVTGLHCLVIDTSVDTGDIGFWTAGAHYTAVLSPDETVDSLAVVKVIATFSLALAPVFARVGAPVGASISADVAAVQADTDNIQTRIPAALVSGRIDASVGAMAAAVLTATAIAADAITDAKVASDVTIASVTGAVGSVTGAVGSVTGNVGGNVTGSVGSVAAGGITASSFAAGAIDNAAIAADAIGSSELAASAVTEIQTGLAAASALATLQTSVDDVPTNAELTTALAGADDAVLAQIALVKAKTDNLPSDPADASDIAASFGTVNATLSTIAGYVDTEVAAIKAKTDNLPDDPADQSLVIAATNAIMTRLGTPADTDIATDIANISGGGSAPTAGEIADEVQTRTIAAVTLVNGLAANSVTAAALAADAGTEIGTAVWASTTRVLTAGTNLNDLNAAGVRAALGMASANLDTQLDALPTNAELTAGFAAADDATLAALATLSSGISSSFIVMSAHGDNTWSTATGFATAASLATTDGKVDEVKDKTDQLAFTDGKADVNIEAVNGVAIIGDGTTGNEWNPAP